MSSFIRRAKNPATGEFEDATWIDHGWRGRNAGYEVRFPSGNSYRAEAIEFWEFDDEARKGGDGC